MDDRGRRRWRRLFILAVAVLVLLGFSLLRTRPGVLVTIRNFGPAPLRSVQLHVTGNSYALGDIAPGATAETTVRSTGESNLEIEFADAEGKVQRLDAGTYLEPGNRGTIRIAMRNGSIERVQQQHQY